MISPSKITEYDPTHPPKPSADDLTHSETGRDDPAYAGSPGPARWPSPNPISPGKIVADPYAGPPASREYETAPLGGNVRGHALAPKPAPAEVKVEPSTSALASGASVAPPPGHLALPKS